MPVVPLLGVQVNNIKTDRDEWLTLYNAVRAVCARHGIEDPFGDADFWVVDDNWGGVTQKIIVSSAKFLTPQLVRQLSQCIIDTQLQGAQIIVILEIRYRKSRLPKMMGLLIGSQGATEEWDIDLLRSKLGNEFYRDRH